MIRDVCLVLLAFVNRKSHAQPCIAVVSCDTQEAEQEAAVFPACKVENRAVKSKAVTRDGIEVNYEIRLTTRLTSLPST